MWYDNLSENTFIKMLYKDVPPLKNLRIEEIKISREGDRITIGFDLPVFADNPPKKWIEGGYTTVFVELDFFDIQEITLRSSNNTYRGNIDIEKDDLGFININISGTVEATIKAGSGLFQSVRGF
ncbi:Imm50 family immunity protein [Paenibacillus sp. CF384]|uniref:Imm50 family immunity protein n=1 Tax=Paenibacillus sp. CF384 TaxID=1884382 RepID=UPI0008970217|nr:Imm50 family immunity protein [Paenibacillus sp. CF384]SDX06338.1 Immunity protein 50 [Paenibacillus sp. CF384]